MLRRAGRSSEVVGAAPAHSQPVENSRWQRGRIPAADDDGVNGSCEAGEVLGSIEREIVGGHKFRADRGSELAMVLSMRLVMLDEAVTPVEQLRRWHRCRWRHR